MLRKNSSILCLLVVLLACLGTLASPSYKTFDKRRGRAAARSPDAETWTNAERLAHGLTPRRPGSLYNPSRVARDAPQPSGVSPRSGNIRVEKVSDDDWVRYIRSSLNSGRLTVTSSSSGRLPIKFVSTTTRFQIEITDNASYKYLGFAGARLTSGNNAFASFVRTNEVAYDSVPWNAGDSMNSGSSESYVWSYNTGSKELTAHWVNPNPSSTTVPVYFFYKSGGGNDGGLYASADYNPGQGLERVRLYFQ